MLEEELETMVDVSELAKLDQEKLEKIQSVISLFHLLGLSDEDIALLPQVLKLWPTVVKNMNLMAQDLAIVKQGFATKDGKGEGDPAINLQKLVGFDSNIENVNFDEGGGNNG